MTALSSVAFARAKQGRDKHLTPRTKRSTSVAAVNQAKEISLRRWHYEQSAENTV